MHGDIDTFWLPKRGAAASEYEDAYEVVGHEGDVGDHGLISLRVIIADGASESMLASRWARHLVREFGAAPEELGTSAGFTAVYERAVDGWEPEVARYMQERAERDSPIQWYEEPGLARGAYSTLLAVEFYHDPENGCARWTAAAIGDSCLFQMRANELHRAFPMVNSEDFNYQPPLLSSRGADADVLSRYLVFEAGDLEAGDTCCIATDALSAWFLGAAEAGDQPWNTIEVLEESAPAEFGELIDKLRDDGRIRDDDTTLVRVNVG